MLRYDLLIFDWDGTLSDSPAHIVSDMQQAINGLGLPPRDDRQIAELIGLGMVESLGRLYPELDLAQLLRKLADYRRLASAEAVAAPLYDGAVKSLTALRIPVIGWRWPPAGTATPCVSRWLRIRRWRHCWKSRVAPMNPQTNRIHACCGRSCRPPASTPAVR